MTNRDAFGAVTFRGAEHLTDSHTYSSAVSHPPRSARYARLWRWALIVLLVAYLCVVGSIVFAPVHVDSGEAGGSLRELLERGHAQGWLPGLITYESVERAANVVMFFPSGVLLGLLLACWWPYLDWMVIRNAIPEGTASGDVIIVKRPWYATWTFKLVLSALPVIGGYLWKWQQSRKRKAAGLV